MQKFRYRTPGTVIRRCPGLVYPFIALAMVVIGTGSVVLMAEEPAVRDEFASGQDPLALPSLGASYKDAFPLGVAVTPDFLGKGNAHEPVIARHFTALVAENCMKPESVQPREGSFDFKDADLLVEYAASHGMKMRGHTLLWHQQTPAWFFKDGTGDASKELVLARLEKHIKTLVGRYAGRIDSWDVVNEVVSDDEGDNGLRTAAQKSRWFAACGPDYIEKAFLWAREADPKAKLYINDYNLESNIQKRDRMLELLDRLKAKNIPVDGVGLQMHIGLDFPALDQIRSTILAFADKGYRVQVTELDMALNGSVLYKGGVTPRLLQAEAKRYADLFALFRELAAKGKMDMVMLWGTDDAQSWINRNPQKPDAPLLLDGQLRTKPAFHAVLEGKGTASSSRETGIRTARAAKGTVKVDGVVDDAWKAAPVHETDRVAMGENPARGSFRFLWDDSCLYVLAEVRDPVVSVANAHPWEQDSVEVFIDRNNNKGKYGPDDNQYRVSVMGLETHDHGSARGFLSVAKVVPGGYLVEMAIPFRRAKEGQISGLDFQVNDDDGSGYRTGISSFFDIGNMNWQGTATFANLVLE